jgi:L,D-transpeptidase catalytic domain
MTRTTRRLRRTAAIACIGLTAAVVVTGTALAADGDGSGGDGGSGSGGGKPHLVEGTPCTDTARACVDLAHNKAWLIHDGQVTRGPVLISHGGQGKETPTGTFQVEWKDQNHKSTEFNDAPMPFAVFFAPGGIAFHQGNPKNPSAGCVHLSKDDAAAWFDDLQVGDEVQVH